MGTAVIVVILVIIVFIAFKSGAKHMKGEGGCCGGSSEKIPEKKLEGDIIAEKIVTIEGMHCQNCKNSVEKRINAIDGAAAKVNLKKNIAVVSMTRDVSDDEIIRAVERLDFKVRDISLKKI